MEAPILAYSRARSASFSIQYQLLNGVARLLPTIDRAKLPRIDLETFRIAQREIDELLRADARNILDGVYPLSVLAPESPVRHAMRLPKILLDGYSIYRRRTKGRTTVFSRRAKQYLDGLPRYYRRNFHFQTDGYLSDRSAELYEHQVEMLFGGGADAMRRLIIPALREAFPGSDGKGLTFLEVGCGTGRATRFVRLAFPRAKIVAVDLSAPYLAEARRKLEGVAGVSFLEADGADMPFGPTRFDAAYSVFLHHELPRAVRRDVVKESMRVVRPGGVVGMVDSIQARDHAELSPLLGNFPKDFHEPFFREYTQDKAEAMLAECGLGAVQSARGFLAKACWGRN